VRLIHYSAKPLLKVHSRKHSEDGAGLCKTPGLWVSVEGEYDWVWWCRAEQWGLGCFKCATEVILADNANIKHLSTAGEIDEFSNEFRTAIWGLDWPAIRRRWRALIIAPYCFDRRYADHALWYYGWDCASGVIWNADAIKELRAIDPPDMTAEAA
jgi:hypothetical protein